MSRRAGLSKLVRLVAPVGEQVAQRLGQSGTRSKPTRVPTDKRQPTVPGQLIQFDTMHLRPLPGVERRQFTATVFLDELIARLPVPVQAIQVDGGSEFMAGFETACQAKGIALYVLPPRSPKLNGRVERLNGTVRREFWGCYDGDLDLPSPTVTRGIGQTNEQIVHIAKFC